MKKLKLVTIFLFILFVSHSSFANNFDHSHKKWTEVLKEHVGKKGYASNVNYKVIKLNPEKLNEYLQTLESVSKKQFDSFKKNQQLAFLINAYNAFTIKLIINHYPVKSIKDIASFFTGPWKIKFFKLFGEEQNLDAIEHEMIRKNFNEPRIHFALVCASIGCPPLEDKSFIGKELNEQLEKSFRKFLSDKSKNVFLSQEKKLEISRIFKWFGDDFNKKYQSFESFISTRITDDKNDQELIKNKKVEISFKDYDWGLNDSSSY